MLKLTNFYENLPIRVNPKSVESFFTSTKAGQTIVQTTSRRFFVSESLSEIERQMSYYDVR